MVPNVIVEPENKVESDFNNELASKLHVAITAGLLINKENEMFGVLLIDVVALILNVILCPCEIYGSRRC